MPQLTEHGRTTSDHVQARAELSSWKSATAAAAALSYCLTTLNLLCHQRVSPTPPPILQPSPVLPYGQREVRKTDREASIYKNK